ncbi:hypothetical protein MMC29_007537 [Sticta canariensis]|nr:hypothetical protein [Sticta canariensis]
MPTPDWKRVLGGKFASGEIQPHVSLSKAKKVFAVDASGSTEGDVMRSESDFVSGLHSNPEDSITRWAGRCEKPQLADSIGLAYFTRKRQWTCLEVILREPSAIKEILYSDIWCLLTDDEITSGGVADLTRLANELELMHIPVMLLHVGEKPPTPKQTNISVYVSFFNTATVGLLLFKDFTTGELSVIAAKGSLAPLASSADNASFMDLSSWKSYPC